MIERTAVPVQNALNDAGIAPSELGKVLLVGGSTRIPAVQDKVKVLTGKEPSRNINPDECVAKGAAILGSTLQGNALVAAVMDNTTGSALYWSEKPYKNEEGNSEQVAVLKADAAHKWNENSCIIIKMQDLRGYIAGIQIEMGASPDGPRDYKFEYSLDGKNK